MKSNTSSTIAFVCSLPALFFVFIYLTGLLGRGWDALGWMLLGLLFSGISSIFSLLAIYYLFRGRDGKFLTIFSIVVNVAFWSIFAAINQ